MNMVHTMNIILLPCLTKHQMNLLETAKKEGRLNTKLYERIRIERNANPNEVAGTTGIRFIFDKNTKTLQAYPLGT